MIKRIYISKKHQIEAVGQFALAREIDTRKKWRELSRHFYALSNVYINSASISHEFRFLAAFCCQRAYV